MTRRDWHLLAAAGLGCGARRPQSDLLPETLAGWQRTALREAPAGDAPAIIPRAAVRLIREADYQAAGRLTARVYDLTSDAVALDLAQRWPPKADTVVFYERNYFVVVNWQQADRQALHNFVRELERRLAL